MTPNGASGFLRNGAKVETTENLQLSSSHSPVNHAPNPARRVLSRNKRVSNRTVSSPLSLRLTRLCRQRQPPAAPHARTTWSHSTISSDNPGLLLGWSTPARGAALGHPESSRGAVAGWRTLVMRASPLRRSIPPSRLDLGEPLLCPPPTLVLLFSSQE